MAEFVRFAGRSYINTDRIVAFDDDTVLLLDGDAHVTVPLEATCRDLQQYIDTKRHERVAHIGN